MNIKILQMGCDKIQQGLSLLEAENYDVSELQTYVNHLMFDIRDKIVNPQFIESMNLLERKNVN